MFEASKHVWLPAKPTNDSMILSFPWVVKACLERWMQVSTVALTGQGETLWLAESPRGRKKKIAGITDQSCQRMLASYSGELSWCRPWKHVLLLFIWNFKEKQSSMHGLHVWDLCSLLSDLSWRELLNFLFYSLLLWSRQTPWNTCTCDLWPFILTSLKGDNSCSWDVYLSHTKTVSLGRVVLRVRLATLRSFSLLLIGRQSEWSIQKGFRPAWLEKGKD